MTLAARLQMAQTSNDRSGRQVLQPPTCTARVADRRSTDRHSAAVTIFEEASPTFKKRFMWMSNYTDESKFDEFAKTLTWEGHAEKIRKPYLVVAGEADELSPLKYTERMILAMTGPRQMVVYADSRHSVGNVPATHFGPFPPTLVADWLVARLNGKPFKSERWFVAPTGQITATAL